MDKNLGYIKLPDELYNIIDTKSKYDGNDEKHEESEKPYDYVEGKYNSKSYIVDFKRLIDPIIISMFYGLYISKKLPPEEESQISLDKSYEFAANISNHVEIFNHFLFCLWVKENGLPTEVEDKIDYRGRLYEFVDKLIDKNYYVDVIIPFYVNESNKTGFGESFLYRMKESGFVPWKSSDKSPEFIAREFKEEQCKFKEEIIDPLLDKINNSPQQFNVDCIDDEFSKILNDGENSSVEYKKSALWSINYSQEQIKNSKSPELHEYGKDASKVIIAKTLAAFLNSYGGNLIIGIEEDKSSNENKIVGVNDDIDLLSKDKCEDGYRRIITDSILRNYFHSEIYNDIDAYLKIEFVLLNEKNLCWIQVKKSDVPIYLKLKKNGKYDHFFIRSDAQSREISGKEMGDYLAKHFR